MPAMFVGASLPGMLTDYWTVKGGMQSWADVLAENFRKLGGVLKLSSFVDKIITKMEWQLEFHVKALFMKQIMLFLPEIIRKPS